jgi:site-specific DNA recombinase
LSVTKAHDQLRQVFGLMSVPDKAIKIIRNSADRIFENKVVEDKRLLEDKKKELALEEAKLFSIEEKWITNKITQDTYDRWFNSINNTRISLRACIERLSGDQDRTYKILQNNLGKLSDLEFVFNNTNTLEKQEFVKLGFEQNLYYQDGVYRTPTMIDLLAHNSYIMKEKRLLIYEKKRENFSIPPLSGLDGT